MARTYSPTWPPGPAARSTCRLPLPRAPAPSALLEHHLPEPLPLHVDRVRAVTGYPGDRTATHEELAEFLAITPHDEAHVTVEHDLRGNRHVDVVSWHGTTVQRQTVVMRFSVD